MLSKKSYNVVAALLFDQDGKILITQRPAGSHLEGLWEFPGGTIEEGESPEQALLREIKEEINLDIKVKKLFWQERFEYDVKKIHISFYLCAITPGRQEVVPLEVADFRWVTIEELPNYKFPAADEALLEKLHKRGLKQD